MSILLKSKLWTLKTWRRDNLGKIDLASQMKRVERSIPYSVPTVPCISYLIWLDCNFIQQETRLLLSVRMISALHTIHDWVCVRWQAVEMLALCVSCYTLNCLKFEFICDTSVKLKKRPIPPTALRILSMRGPNGFPTGTARLTDANSRGSIDGRCRQLCRAAVSLEIVEFKQSLTWFITSYFENVIVFWKNIDYGVLSCTIYIGSIGNSGNACTAL